MSAPPGADYTYLREVVFHHSQNVLEPSHDHLFQSRLVGWDFYIGMGCPGSTNWFIC